MSFTACIPPTNTLNIGKRAEGVAAAGDPILYWIDYDILNTTSATTVRDVLPAGVVFLQAAPGASAPASNTTCPCTVSWNAGNANASSNPPYHLKGSYWVLVTVPVGTANGTVINNTAAVTNASAGVTSNAVSMVVGAGLNVSLSKQQLDASGTNPITSAVLGTTVTYRLNFTISGLGLKCYDSMDQLTNGTNYTGGAEPAGWTSVSQDNNGSEWAGWTVQTDAATGSRYLKATTTQYGFLQYDCTNMLNAQNNYCEGTIVTDAFMGDVATDLGVMIRWKIGSTGNNYRAIWLLMSKDANFGTGCGGNLGIQFNFNNSGGRDVVGCYTAPTQPDSLQWYTIKVVTSYATPGACAGGMRYQAKYWVRGTPEPAGYQLSYTDTAHDYCGADWGCGVGSTSNVWRPGVGNQGDTNAYDNYRVFSNNYIQNAVLTDTVPVGIDYTSANPVAQGVPSGGGANEGMVRWDFTGNLNGATSGRIYDSSGIMEWKGVVDCAESAGPALNRGSLIGANPSGVSTGRIDSNQTSLVFICSTPTNTPTRTNTLTNTNTPTRTPTPTITPTRTNTNTRTNTPTFTNTNTNSITPTPTFTRTPTPTFTNTRTNTPTRTPTPTNTFTRTPTPTNTNTNTISITPTPTFTRTPTPTFTNTRTNTFTNTMTPTPTFTRTHTPTFTPTYTISITPTPTFTRTPTPTFTNTRTNTFTNTMTPTRTFTRTHTPTFTPTYTISITPTPTFTSTRTPTFTRTWTPPLLTYTFTNTWTITRTPTITNTNTISITPTPTFTRTRTPTFTRTWTPPLLTYTFTNTWTITNTPTITSTHTISITPTPTFTSTRTPTVTESPVPPLLTFTFTHSPTSTHTVTWTDTATDSLTPTASFTSTPTSTFTNTPTDSVTDQFTPTFSLTPTDTNTATPTLTRTDTHTRTHTFTRTDTLTATPTRTASLTRTETLTRTPTFTRTHTPLFTLTRTMTWTRTETLTRTPTLTRTDTRTPTFTRTHTPTFTPTWTRTHTLTRTFTMTRTFTRTHTNTNTPTPSLTPTPSFTDTSTFTDTPTPTITPTPTNTPALAYTVKIAVYNAAGELVEILSVQQLPEGVLGVRGEADTVIERMNDPVELYWKGVWIGRWDGNNQSGSPVSNGEYYVKVDSVDPYGVTTTVTMDVTVNRDLSKLTVLIYNASGEIVRHLYESVRDGDQMLEAVGLSGDTIEPSYGSPGGGPATLTVTLPDGTPVPWDGRSDSGDLVADGQYYVVVESGGPSGSGGASVTRSVAVISSGVTVHPVRVRPNVLAAGNRTAVFETYPAQSALVEVKIYTTSGELVRVLNGVSSVTWDASAVSSGLYLAVVVLHDNEGVRGRQIMKLLVE